MYEVAGRVREWLDEGRQVTVATLLATRGFSSREPAATLAWTADEPPVGRLIAGIGPDAFSGAGGVVDVGVAEADAVASGLACGGVASVLVRDAGDYPKQLWERLVGAEAVCVVVPTSGGVVRAYSPAETEQLPEPVRRLFGSGATATAMLEDAAVVALWPVPTVLVVGVGVLADALRDTGAVLGWPVRVAAGADDADVADVVAAVSGLRRSDAVVVLSHDRAVDGPALSSALTSGVGYIGALGSRRTQAARRDWLRERGVPGHAQQRIHGPVGLDIGARTPAEIAIAIFAEIVSERRITG